jgi:16S rRNA (guanine527-N7)-methyltransferase
MFHVKHESDLPRVPDYAADAFPAERLALAELFAVRLATDGVIRGLVGPREVPRLWDRHILNCAALSPVIPPGSTVADLGAGAGLPGLVLAIARSDLQVTLVEPLLRRTTFLEEVVTQLGLTNVEVIRGRAESLHGARVFDVVTSRALAPMDRLLAWSIPLVREGGALVAMKGASVGEELTSAEHVLSEFGCSPPELIALTQADGVSTTTVVRVSWSGIRKVGLASQPAKFQAGESGSRTSARSKNKRRRRSGGSTS